MNMTKPLAAVSAGLLLGSSIAVAQEIPFEQLDVDGTGVLTIEEALAHPQMTTETFDAVDADGTGVLTPEQYESFVSEYADPIDEAG